LEWIQYYFLNLFLFRKKSPLFHLPLMQKDS
jgi:hypothetical protein